MSKIDDFFKTRLDTDTFDHDDWNVPSDDLWDKALPHFPKEEKKRRSFIWLWLTIGLLFSASITYYLVNGDQAIVESDLIVSSKKDDGSNNVGSKENIENISLDNSIASKKTDEEISNFTHEGQNLNADFKKESSTSANSQFLSLDKNLEPQNAAKEISNTLVASKERLKKELKNAYGSEVENMSLDKQSILTSDSESLDEKNNVEVVGSEMEVGKEVQLVEEDKEMFFIEKLRGLQRNKLLVSKRTAIPNGNSNFIKPQKQVRPLMELGVSTQYFLLNSLEGVDLDESENGTVFFDGRFINLNLEYARWIGRKWSITTGINYGDILLNLDIDTDFIYDENDFVQDINSEYNDVFDKSYQTSTSGSPVVLSPGVELFTGDVVRLKGSVDLGLRAIQIPFILNYHWYNKRFEFYTGVGFTVESIWARENNIDFSLFDNNVLLTEPSTQSDLSEQYFDYSIYGKLGTKININKHLNFDTAISILANDAAFSGLEFGFHYRWHH